MARVKGAMMARKRRNKVLKAAKGYWGAKSKHFKMAKQERLPSSVDHQNLRSLQGKRHELLYFHERSEEGKRYPEQKDAV